MANVKGTTEVVKTVAAKKVEEAKEAAKTVAETPKQEEKTADQKEAVPAKAQKAEKKTRKTTAKTTKAAKKTVADPKVYVQFGASESSVDTIVDKIKAEYVAQGHRASSIKDLRVYLKPEDGAAYYVINEKVAGRVDLF